MIKYLPKTEEFILVHVSVEKVYHEFSDVALSENNMDVVRVEGSDDKTRDLIRDQKC